MPERRATAGIRPAAFRDCEAERVGRVDGARGHVGDTPPVEPPGAHELQRQREGATIGGGARVPASPCTAARMRLRRLEQAPGSSAEGSEEAFATLSRSTDPFLDLTVPLGRGRPRPWHPRRTSSLSSRGARRSGHGVRTAFKTAVWPRATPTIPTAGRLRLGPKDHDRSGEGQDRRDAARPAPRPLCPVSYC